MSESSIKIGALVGKKAGMTRIFDEKGNHIPVTVIELVSNKVSQVKTKEKDGYTSYQIAFNPKREVLVNKSIKGILAKASIEQNLTMFTEFKLDSVSSDNAGKSLDQLTFEPGAIIDVEGVSKGKGFAGVMKRYNFRGGPASHGSHFHRRVGSIGNRATPGRVFKNKKMPGHMGVEKCTVQNLQVVEVNQEKGYLLIKGSVPGSKNSYVKITKARKSL